MIKTVHGIWSPLSNVSACVQRALGEFPEKELQLQQMEGQGQRVLHKTSEDGQVHISQDMMRLQDSWAALFNMSHNLHRYQKILFTVD